MKVNCQLSCKIEDVCPPDDALPADCEPDKNVNCPQWGSMGYCTGQWAAYMSENCQATCLTCSTETAETDNKGEESLYCMDEYGRFPCHNWKALGYCEESSNFFNNMQTKCAYTCGVCETPKDTYPFSVMAQDCSGFRDVGDFFGYFQMKEGSTMDQGTLTFTVYKGSWWLQRQEYDSSLVNALQIALKKNDHNSHARSKKMYYTEQTETWSEEENKNGVEVFYQQPKEFGGSFSVDIPYTMNLNDLSLGMHLYSPDRSHSVQSTVLCGFSVAEYMQ